MLEELQADLDGLLAGVVSLGNVLIVCCEHLLVQLEILGVLTHLRGNRLSISGSIDLSNVLPMNIEAHFLEGVSHSVCFSVANCANFIDQWSDFFSFILWMEVNVFLCVRYDQVSKGLICSVYSVFHLDAFRHEAVDVDFSDNFEISLVHVGVHSEFKI
jgi:hypothetical protein